MEFETLLNRLQADYHNKKNITHLLDLLLKEIQNQLLKIKACNSISEAEVYFATLSTIQLALAKLIFIHNLEATPALNTFVWDFDRIDDPEWKNYLFNQIICNEYLLLNIEDNTHLDF